LPASTSLFRIFANMALHASKVLETTPGFEAFDVVELNPRLGALNDSTDIGVVDEYQFFLNAPPSQRDPQHSIPILIATPSCGQCHGALAYFAYCITKTWAQEPALSGHAPNVCLVHQNHTSLVSGVKEGCHLCHLIFSSLYQYKKSMRVIEETAIEMSWTTNAQGHGEPSTQDEGKTVKIQFTVVKTLEPRSTHSCWNFMHLRSWSSSSRASRPKASSTMSSTRSEQCRELALQWLAQCTANLDGRHTQCNERVPQYMPTRLLDVECALHTSLLKLVSQQVAPSDYITLSHCWGAWGKTELPSLTTGNKAEREKDGIGLDQLPQTFKDAVEISSWFGGRYARPRVHIQG
jgi:hypothetical protein